MPNNINIPINVALSEINLFINKAKWDLIDDHVWLLAPHLSRKTNYLV